MPEIFRAGAGAGAGPQNNSKSSGRKLVPFSGAGAGDFFAGAEARISFQLVPESEFVFSWCRWQNLVFNRFRHRPRAPGHKLIF